MSTRSAPADGEASEPRKPSIPKRVWNALFHPVIRLRNDFPLTGAKLGKHYAIATTIFFIGSFIPGLLLVAAVYALLKFAKPVVAVYWLQFVYLVKGQTVDFQPTALTLLILTSFMCRFITQISYISRVLRRCGRKMSEVLGFSLKPLGESFCGRLLALTWRVVLGSLFIMGVGEVLGYFLGAPVQPTVEYMKQAFGANLLVWALMAAVLAPLFEEIVFRGFLFQALRATFLRWQNPDAPDPPLVVSEPQPRSAVQRPDTRLRKALRLAGKVLWWLTMPVWVPLWVAYVLLRTAAIVIAVFVCLLFVVAWELVHSPAWLLWFLARPFARLLWWLTRPLVMPCYRALCWVGRGFAWLSRAIPRWIGKYFINTPGKADLAAVVLSGALFAVEHMQFHPVTLLLLFVMGCYLAETFRRTGTLWTGICIHGVNNAISVLMIAMFR